MSHSCKDGGLLTSSSRKALKGCSLTAGYLRQFHTAEGFSCVFFLTVPGLDSLLAPTHPIAWDCGSQSAASRLLHLQSPTWVKTQFPVFTVSGTSEKGDPVPATSQRRGSWHIHCSSIPPPVGHRVPLPGPALSLAMPGTQLLSPSLGPLPSECPPLHACLWPQDVLTCEPGQQGVCAAPLASG